ncbi:NAD(P)-binding protein [Janthinobacterium sp. J1-1]|uniref:NAD(P)-binding protein n=1 Tax=unclassified Janthinobacterium TaxID=2610881 RepID=UPI00281140D3|nr:NAD(P)-binding protein [Janthinobacterium sp. J1-1]
MLEVHNAFLALIAHKIAPFQFDIGFGVVNASIRDQIVRAQMIVRALAQLNESHRTRPLLICGAGIAGLAAATEAKRIGLGFVLIDKEEFPSGALAGAGTRYLSPTMYEWPAHLFDEHRHPPADGTFLAADKKTGFLMNFTAPVSMEKLRLDLEAKLGRNLITLKNNAKQFKKKNWYLPNIRIDDSSKKDLQSLLTPVDPIPTLPIGLPPIILTDALSGVINRTIEVDWIIFAGGFSAEETNYAGIDFDTPPFWSSDDLTHLYFGITGISHVSALIVGSGDGAIQDAIRCLIDKKVPHPVAIWKEIIKDITPNITHNPRNLDVILKEILSLDQYSNTSYMWSGKKEIFQSVDAAHVRLANELLALQPSIGNNIRSILRSDVSLVRIQRNRKYFTRCYALNRFLIHLIKIVLDIKQILRKCPKLVFGHGNIEESAISLAPDKKTYTWKSHTFHRVVIRIGGKYKDYQTIGLSGIDAARVQFGRIPPPFVPTKS